MDTKITEIISFWFGSKTKAPEISQDRGYLWFKGGAAADQEIKEKYEADLRKAIASEYDHWVESPEGSLALIILFDQFSRNIFRAHSQAFAQDSKALSWSLRCIDQKQDIELRLIERVFCYLPLEHSETKEMQELSVQKFADLKNAAPEDEKSTFESFYQYALRHQEVIEAFGRFPGRNKALERESSAAELEYLEKSGSAF